MTFLSPDFMLLFLVTAALYFSLPRRLRPGVLLAASLVFYGWLQISFLALLVVQILFTHFSALWLDRRKGPAKRRAFLIALAGIISPLLVFKYLDFILRSLSSLVQTLAHGKPLPLLSLALPAGISFYTFKSLSYLIDVYRARLPAERNPVLVGLYVSFFPQILAGPIERAEHFMAQFKRDSPFDASQAAEGLKLIVRGIFKKVVMADRLAQYVTVVFDRPQDHSGLSLVFGLVFFSFQVYCDFSGYSDMAIGLAKVLGLETMENFNFPYFSRSIPEFWSRWHISLSSWLRDYLFLPISYGLSRRIKPERVLFLKTDFLLYFCAMGVTMLLCGLWHGANWTFIVWGGVHGLYLIVSRAGRKLRRATTRFLRIRTNGFFWNAVRTLLSFSLVSLAWVFFRSPSLGKAWAYLGNISLTLPRRGVGHLLFLGSLLAVFILAEFLMKNREKFLMGKKMPAPAQAVLYALLLCLIIILAADTGNEFLYFQF